MVLETSELICGTRSKEELLSCREAGLVDLIVWIENNRVPVDTTVTYTREDCDLLILNNGSIEEFHFRLHRLAKALGFIPFRRPV